MQTITGLPSQNYQTSSTNEATQVDLAVNITQTPMSTTSTDTSTPTISTDTMITTTSSAKTLGTTTTPPSGKAKFMFIFQSLGGDFYWSVSKNLCENKYAHSTI